MNASDNKPFWSSLPGILTGAATLITAIGGVIGGTIIALDRIKNDEGVAPGTSTVSPPALVTEIDPSEWPVFAEDTFTVPNANWSLGDFPSVETPKYDLRIQEGRYRWDLDYSRQWSRWVIAPYASLINFSVAVDVRMPEYIDIVSAGLLFGMADNEHFIFSVSSNGFFNLIRYDAMQSYTVVDWTPVAVTFDAKRWNRIKVIVDKQQFRFYLNNHLLGEYFDSSFAGGKTGLNVEMYDKAVAVVDFDDFEIRRKP